MHKHICTECASEEAPGTPAFRLVAFTQLEQTIKHICFIAYSQAIACWSEGECKKITSLLIMK